MSTKPAHIQTIRLAAVASSALLALSWLTFGRAAQQTTPHAGHQHGQHEHGEAEPKVEPPKIFLDKSPRIVWYQLNRLSNERLLLVERKPDHPQYAIVYTAILSRAGMSRQHREEALAGLTQLNQTDAVTELLKTIQEQETDDRAQQQVARQLAAMVLARPAKELGRHSELLSNSLESDQPVLRSTALAALIVAGQAAKATQFASTSMEARFDFLAAVPMVRSATLRSDQRPTVVDSLDEQFPPRVRRAAITALAAIPADRTDTYRRLAPLVENQQLKDTAVRSLLKIQANQRDKQVSAQLLDLLVQHAEQTPAAKRTTDEFIDAMQLAERLLADVGATAAREYRERLGAVTVRLVRIKTVEEEMRYDTAYFAVEAGRPVQVILQNEDLMPHNLVITVPGALRSVAEEGAAVGPDGGADGKQYVPPGDDVLFATNMVQAHQQERLTFTAPDTPGEYPYVCTFPRHWMRMYGVMVVVEDLDAWLQNPTVPKDPIGSNRSFVQAWTVEDFAEGLEEGLRGRSPEIGYKLFREGTCAQCHKLAGSGGEVGPDLTDVLKRWKGDRLGVLREVLDPSHKIDPKYAVHVIILDSGKVVSGIIKAQDKSTVSVLDNPESKMPRVIQRSEIDEMVQTTKSMMPKALLDRFTRDEVLEILHLLEHPIPAPSE